MSKPKSYRQHNSCVNCKHCWRKWNPEYLEIFCSKGVTKIPAFYKYPQDGIDSRVYEAEQGHDDSEGFHIVDTWEMEHRVEENGICDFWEKK
jgi:hypothetical protein